MADSDSYAGDLDPAAAYALLAADPDAVLVDVRTRPEWSFVGVPDLGELGKQPLLIEWQSFPSMQVDPQFVDRLAEALARQGLPLDAPVLFLCRSGARSQAAAIALSGAGRPNCFNVADGFEGPRDAGGHRGGAAGWKASGLPWGQS